MLLLEELNLEFRNSKNMRDTPMLWPKEDSTCWNYFNSEERKRFKNKPPGYHMPHDIIELLSKENRHTVIQAGGNSGLYASIYSKYFSRVITFEPDYRWFTCLCHNASQSNVFKFNSAVGNNTESVSLEVPLLKNTKNLGGIYVKENGIIPKLEIDSFGISPNLIHLDIEGAEWDALEGSLETIKRSKPLIVVEWDLKGITRFGWTIDKVSNLFSNLGYDVVKEWKRDKAFACIK